MKILILGHAGHGKDTVANLLVELHGFKFYSATEYIVDNIVYPSLRSRYNNREECISDKNINRALWYDLIYDYKGNIVEEVLELSDIYVGLRDINVLMECISKKTFDLILCVYNPFVKLEDTSSMTIPIFMYSDIVVLNNKGIGELRDKLKFLNLTM